MPRVRSTWTPEQAAAARIKSLEVRRRNAANRKLVKAETVAMLESVRGSDPIADLQRAISLAARRNQGQLCANLALALSRLQISSRTDIKRGARTEAKPRPPAASIEYVPTQNQTKSDPGPVPDSASASSTETETKKEIYLNPGPVGAGLPGQGAPVGATHALIDRITRR